LFSQNESALYYTFSTIAQTMAACFAFLVAFVLYRMPSVEEVIERASGYVRANQHLLSFIQAWQLLLHEGFDSLVQRYAQIARERTQINIGGNNVDELRAVFNEAVEHVKLWNELQARFKACFLVTVSTIVVAVVSLPLVPLPRVPTGSF
jgi:hypothetical protein